MKVITTLEQHLLKIPQGQRIQALQLAFGKQGARAAAILASPQFMEQWPGLHRFMKAESGKSPEELYTSLYKGSAVQKAIQTREKLVVTLMKLANVLLPTLNSSLDHLNHMLDKVINFESKHPRAANAIGTATGVATAGFGLNWLMKKIAGRSIIGALGLTGPEGAAAAAIGTGLYLGYDWYKHSQISKKHSSIFEAGGDEAVKFIQSLEDMFTGAVKNGMNGATIHMKDNSRGKIHRASHPSGTSGDTGAIIPNPPAR